MSQQKKRITKTKSNIHFHNDFLFVVDFELEHSIIKFIFLGYDHLLIWHNDDSVWQIALGMLKFFLSIEAEIGI